MARIKGQANYASNFEVLKQAPLDSRTVVSEYSDLIKQTTWQDADGNVWLYDGLTVTVPRGNKASVYVLVNKDKYTEATSWVELGADNASSISAITEALEKKANLEEGKVPATELPIVNSFVQDDDTTIPSAKLVNDALTAVGNTLEKKINDKVAGLLHWQGVKSTTSEIKAITSAKKGDVWHSNGDGSEWVCTQDITTANADAWTELGTPIDLSGYYTKAEVDGKVKPLADSIGTDSDVASANGSLYARIKKNAADIATKASATELEGVKEKVNTLNNKVDKNAEAIGTAEDSASVNGSLYARVKKNADDIATKASNSDLAALQSKVDNKANKTALETLQASVGNTSDAADASGSVYARIAQNRKDVLQNRLNINTKASNADLEALASRVTGLEDGMPTAVQLVVRTI